jgi:Gpi18-like mannosyltransferase
MFNRRHIYHIISAYILHTFLVLVSAIVTVTYLPSLHRAWAHNVSPLGKLIQALSRWDGVWYLKIATKGYPTEQPTAFFPLYPILTRYLGKVIHLFLHDYKWSFILAGLLLANVAFLAALFFFYNISVYMYSERVANKAVMLLAVYPMSFFFTAMYTESLFFCLVAGSFYFAHKKKWGWAGVFAGLAALTRNLGVFLIFPLLIMYFKSIGFSFRTIKDFRFSWEFVRRIIEICIVPCLFFACYPFYLYRKFGMPLAFLDAQKFWFRKTVFPWVSLWHSLHFSLVEFSFSAVFLLLLIFGFKKLKFEHWLYMFFGLIIPLCSVSHGLLMSMPRFTTVLFPGFIYLAYLIRTRYIETSIFIVSILLLLFYMGRFAAVYWVA